jgi:hypothetical protein
MSSRSRVRLTAPRWARAAVAAIACAVALLGTGAHVAGAVAVCVPPGASGVSQYFETIPGASCNQKPGTGGRRGGGGLPPGTARKLASQGPAGASVAQLVASSGTAPPPPAGRRGASGAHARARHGQGSGGRGALGGARLPAVRAGSPLAAVIHPLVSGSGGGGGPLLAYLLAAAALVIVAVALLRARRARGGR